MKSAIVTGAAGAIGAAICSAFRREGYFVIGIDLHACPAADVFVPVDLRSFASPAGDRSAAVRAITNALAGRSLKCLVNNAAVQRIGRTAELTDDDWQVTLSVNLLAPFFLVQCFLPQLKAAGGSVVNVSSIHANLTKPAFVAYATSKGGLTAMTRAMAVDVAPDVRVNAVLPAAVRTDMLISGFADNPAALSELEAMHPIGRIATVDEIAEVVAFLASDKSGFVSGATWGIDGAIASRLHDPI